MTTTQYLRGSVVLCDFPFVERPDQRGSSEHFCLVVHAEEEDGRKLVAVCYGTSRLDEKMLASHGGAILSVPSRFIKISRGKVPGDVAHFVCDHVALIPESWINDRFTGRLDFIRADARQSDPVRQRLYQAFERFESLMQVAALQAVEHKRITGKVGLPPGKSLR